MTLHMNLIDGEWVERRAGAEPQPVRTSRRWSASTRAPPPRTPRAAIAAAKAAFPAWSRSGPLERHGVLRKAADEITARKEELGRLLAREEGKTLPEGIGETVRAAQIFDFFAGECLRLTGETVPSVRPGVGVEMTREAVGVVGLITPWNFPIAIPAWKIAPALAYGNTVVLKPADLVPGCTWAIVDILHRAGPAEGGAEPRHGQGLGGRPGDPRQPGRQRDQLHRQPGDRRAGRRGERQGDAPLPARDGRQEPARGARRRRPRRRRSTCAVNGAFFSTGQRCTASSRLIVTEGIHDRFVAAVAEQLKALKVDDPLKEGTQIGPVVDAGQLKQDEDYIAIGKGEGAELVCGRRAAGARRPRASSCRRRSSSGRPTRCGSAARRSSGRWRA